MKKRIAFILGGMKRGGAERVISILANHYVEMGWDVNIIMLLNNKVEYKLAPEVNFVDLSDENKSRWAMVPYWLKGIRGYIKNFHPDILMSFAARINLLTIIAKAFIKVPLIISERNDPKADTRGHLAKMMIPFLYPLADKIVFQTEYAKSCFTKHIRENGVIIYNPIAVMSKASDEKAKKIVNVGRLDVQKNQRLLIRAFARISEKYPDYILQIYGEGKLREELQQLIEELGLTEKVFLMGNILDIHEKIRDAEMFVLSSDYEGFSNALLEALLMGIPCISTTCAGSTEIINDGENGLLVPINDIYALTEAMMKLIEDKELAKKLGENALNINNLVGEDIVVGKWDKLIFDTVKIV